jgi:hypothetical protein
MVKLIYSAITSLDGYVADERGKFDWSAPDDEVHRLVNDLERPIGTYLYGRRMYEVMVYWETAHTVADQPPFIRDYSSAAPTWPPRRSGPGWSTSTTCSSRPSWWEAAHNPSPTVFRCSSNYLLNAASPTASSTSAMPIAGLARSAPSHSVGVSGTRILCTWSR